MIKTRQELIECPIDLRPHVVLLGAGASRAAFPEGDSAGRPLPIMSDLVEIVGLESLLEREGQNVTDEWDFEAIYGRLADEPVYEQNLKEIEEKIGDYFSGLSLPKQATLYDKLLLSLRPIDAVFTFNWDPFLFDGYRRNHDIVPLPEIFFLHGNVRIGACPVHDKWGPRTGRCPVCHQPFADVPLLYPVTNKDYSNDPYIRASWHAARILFRDAFTLTIFGYGAPASDKDAVELLQLAWTEGSDRQFEHIQVIDTGDRSLLHERWSPFTPTLRYAFSHSFEHSRIARWPRRSCEALKYPMTQGVPCEDFPVPATDDLALIQAFAADIAQYESADG